MSIIRTQDLSYIYSQDTPFEIAAIKNVNIEIEKGDFVGLIGHTGSGKTTLVQHLNGLIKPKTGKVFIDEEDISAKDYDIKKLRFKVGLVFQYPEYQLFDETVESDIAFGPKNMGLSDDEIKERVNLATEVVGLSSDLLKKSPFDLSGGEKRRAALAGVLAMKPKVLVLDEPTAGLDPVGRDTILERISDYRKNSDTTVILVSHSMEDVAKVADKVLVMKDGAVAMFGKTEEVYSRGAELVDMGLNVPHITKVIMGLRERGFDINSKIYTVEAAKNEVLRLLRKGGKNAE